jgi:hypothetical protein
MEMLMNRDAGSASSTEDILLQAPGPICVVGNAAMKYPFGAIIDSYATVIRMNNYKIAGFEQLVGSRTDYRCVTGWTDVENRNEHMEFSAFSAEVRESGNLDVYNSRNARKVITARNDMHPFTSEVRNPSSGFMLVQLFDFLEIPVDLFGFDGFKSGHYWNNEPVRPYHSPKEIDYILQRRNVVLYNDYEAPQENMPESGDASRLDLLPIISPLLPPHADKHLLISGMEDEKLISSLQGMGNIVTVIEPSGSLRQLNGARILRNGVLSLLWEEQPHDLFVAGSSLARLTRNECTILSRRLGKLCKTILIATNPLQARASSGNPHLNHEWWQEGLSGDFQFEVLNREEGWSILRGFPN